MIIFNFGFGRKHVLELALVLFQNDISTIEVAHAWRRSSYPRYKLEEGRMKVKETREHKVLRLTSVIIEITCYRDVFLIDLLVSIFKVVCLYLSYPASLPQMPKIVGERQNRRSPIIAKRGCWGVSLLTLEMPPPRKAGSILESEDSSFSSPNCPWLLQ